MEKKICDADKNYLILVGILKKADFNAKITEAKNKIPSTTGLVTSFALTAVENETPNVCSLLRKKKQIMIQIFQILIKINVMQKYQVLKKKKKKNPQLVTINALKTLLAIT